MENKRKEDKTSWSKENVEQINIIKKSEENLTKMGKYRRKKTEEIRMIAKDKACVRVIISWFFHIHHYLLAIILNSILAYAYVISLSVLQT